MFATESLNALFVVGVFVALCAVGFVAVLVICHLGTTTLDSDQNKNLTAN